MDIEAIRSDWVGRVIDGRFTLLQWLGGSEWSGVFLTELLDPRPQKAAIKLILADDQDAEAYMADWALTTTLSHPHLMRVFQTGRCQTDTVSLLYTVTEYADEVLSQILPERPLTATETGEMLVPVLDALAYLHSRGFVHGHLKPANIMVVGDQLKISSDSLQVAGERRKRFVAYSGYDAPEVATEAVSAAADVWSLGITVIEALTQVRIIWDRSAHREPMIPEAVPAPFATFAEECLRSAPERRATVSGLKARLKDSQSAPKTAKTGGGSLTPKLRVAALTAAVVILIAILALGARRIQTAFESSDKSGAGSQPQVSSTQNPSGATVKGAVARQVMPEVPDEASDTIQGLVDVRVRVTVNANGNVADTALDSPSSSRYFANLALQAARNWRFKPAQVGGQAVSSVWILRFQFRRAGTSVTSAETSP